MMKILSPITTGITRLKVYPLIPHIQASLFSSSSSSSSDDQRSEIPAELRRKDWLSPTQVHHLFASLPDPSSIVSALDHYSNRKDYTPNEPLFSLILVRLAQARLFADAHAVFLRVTSGSPCRLSDDFFRLAIGLFGPDRAVQILFDMPRKHGCWPSTDTFNSVLDLLVSARMFRTVHRVFVAAPRLGVAIDSGSLNVMVKGLCECGKLDAALQVLDEFPHIKCRPDSSTFTALVRGFCGAGRVDEAMAVFERMGGVEAGVGVFNALIGGLAGQGRVDEAMAVFERMRLEGCVPDAETYRAAFSGLVAAWRFSEAKELVGTAATRGVVPSLEAYESLIRGLCQEENRNGTDDVGWVLEEMTRQGFVPNAGMWSLILQTFFRGKTSDAYQHLIIATKYSH